MTGDDTQVKELDSRIIRKLMKFAAPYRIWFILAGIALILSTAAELALPVILQKTIDRHILSEWTWIRRDAQEEILGQDVPEQAVRLEDRLFLLSSDIPSLTASARDALMEADRMGRESWYLFPMAALPPEWKASGLITSPETGTAALPYSVLRDLDRDHYRMIRQADLKGLRNSTGWYFLMLGIVLIFSFIQVYAIAWTSQGVMKDLRMKMLSHVTGQSLGYLGDTPVGTLVSRVTSDVETVNEFFTSVTISLLKDGAMMAGVMITLFLLNPLLALITLLTLPPVLIATVVFRKLARKAYRKQRHWIGKVNGFLSEHISGMEVIQIFGREKKVRGEFGEHNSQLLKASLAEMYVFAVFRPIVDLLTSVSLGVVLYWGAGMVNRNVLTLGVLIAFIDLIQKFYRPVMDMSEKFTIMQSAMAGGERIFEMLDEDHSLQDEGKRPLPAHVEGALEFRNVTFAYKGDEDVLRDLSFRAAPGETVAIVGYTGAGKTTIASLASRLWDIREGQILLDGSDIRKFPIRDLRQTIQPVQQDVFLFSGTVSDNISLGSPISRERIREAARLVQADSFIRNLPDGYDTVIQERGSNLSSGQRQLLSFARAIAHDPRVIILDEATARIDTETEKLVQQALETLLKGRTSLVIAHRISTIQKADRILVLSQGELVESGTHEELLARRDLYYSLYQLQYESGRLLNGEA